MTKRQDKVVEMLKRLAAFKKKNVDALSLLVALNALFDELDEKIDLIDALKFQQQNNTKGSTNQKNDYRLRAIQKGAEIIFALKAFVKASGNKILEMDVDFTETELKNMGGDNLKLALDRIHGNALKYTTELLSYGVTVAKITDFRSAIDLFAASITTPKDGKIDHKNVTDKIDNEVDAGLDVAKQVDLVIGSIRYTNATLYNEYQNVRQIESYTRSFTARVQVTDAATGVGIGGAKVLFLLADDVVLDKLTATGGGVNIKSIDEGEYTVDVSKLGYATQTLHFIVTDDQTNALAIKLVKQV